MPALEFHYRDGGIYLPHLRLWLDPHRAKQELAFVSHAHSDHTARHREVILTAPTARFMTERLGGKRTEHLLNFGEQKTFRAEGGVEFAITLLSAGHIFGSAMSFIEADGESLRKVVREQIRAGADWIKVYADTPHGPGPGSKPAFSLDELKQIVATAKDAGVPVVAHANSAEGM